MGEGRAWKEFRMGGSVSPTSSQLESACAASICLPRALGWVRRSRNEVEQLPLSLTLILPLVFISVRWRAGSCCPLGMDTGLIRKISCKLDKGAAVPLIQEVGQHTEEIPADQVTERGQGWSSLGRFLYWLCIPKILCGTSDLGMCCQKGSWAAQSWHWVCSGLEV